MGRSRKLAVAVLLAVAGCSTVGTVTPISGSGAAIPSASAWSLTIRGCPEPAQCEELRSAVASRLIGSGLAERVVGPGQSAQLGLDVQVSNVRAVPGAVRVLFGTMAGRNSVTAVGTVTDLRGPARTTLRSFTIESASASHPFSGESSVGDAYRQFATDTVAALRS